MRLTIYLPDDLGEMVKAEADLNVSSVCQSALRAELDGRKLCEELVHVADEMFEAVA